MRLGRLATQFANVRYINLRGTTHENEWWDELHPESSAAERMAKIFAAELNIVVSAAAPKTGRRRKAQAKKAA